MHIATKLGQEFFNALLRQRNTAAACAFLSAHARFTDASHGASVLGKDKIATYLRQALPHPDAHARLKYGFSEDAYHSDNCASGYMELECSFDGDAYMLQVSLVAEREGARFVLTSVHLSVSQDAGAQTRAAVLPTQDLPSHKNTVLHSSACLEALQKAAGAALWQYDVQSRRLLRAGTLLEGCPYIPADANGRIDHSLAHVHPDSAEEYKHFLHNLETGTPAVHDICMMAGSTQKCVWRRFAVVPVHDKDGNLERVEGCCLDTTAERKYSRLQNQLDTMLLNVMGGVIFFTYEQGALRITDCTPAAHEMLGLTRDAFLQATSFLDVVVEEDRMRVHDAFARALSSGQPEDAYFRTHHADGHVVWMYGKAVCTACSLDKLTGGHQFFATFVDVSAQKNLDEVRQVFQNLTQNVSGGIFQVSLSRYGCFLLDFNEQFARLSGRTTEDCDEYRKRSLLDLVYEEDRESLGRELAECLQGQRDEVEHEFRVWHKLGHILWVKVRASLTRKDDRDYIYNGIITDISDEKRKTAELARSGEAMRIAMQQTGISFWMLDIPTHTLYFTEGVAQLFGVEQVLSFPESSLLELGLVHEQDTEATREMFERVYAGEEPEPIDVRVLRRDTGQYVWLRTTVTVLLDELQRPASAVGSLIDVSEEKAMQERFNSEVDDLLRLSRQDNVRSYFRFNVTRDRVEDCHSQNEELAGYCLEGKTSMQALHKYLSVRAPATLSNAESLNFCDREHLLQCYADGVFKLDYETLFQGGDAAGLLYLQVNVRLTRNPVSGDVIAFVYTLDVTRKYLIQNMISGVVEMHYDYVCCVDMRHNTFITVNSSGSESMVPSSGSNFRESMVRMLTDHIEPDKLDSAIQASGFDVISRALEQQPTYDFVVQAKSSDGRMRTKRIQYSWLDREQKLLLLTQTDITNIMEDTERDREQLSQALTTAEKANKVKTEFLARMSHEIRTPINAIIGMTNMAMNSDDKDRVGQCIEKIDVSSKLLLNIINDILDMSRIESGSMFIKSEPVSLSDLQGSVDDVTHSLMEAKGISFAFKSAKAARREFLGDRQKLRQIVQNLINNAAKFTYEGGKVILAVTLLHRKGRKGLLRIVAHDNGCGIAPEFLPHVFEPFAQEHVGSTTAYGGTGLGMSISYNFVKLMGGSMHVHSKLGNGAQFVVDVPIGIAYEGEDPIATMVVDEEVMAANAGKRVLLVEDVPINMEVARFILEDAGFVVEEAVNGQEAVDKFLASPIGYYQCILMDIRMPVMDGLEATRKIRQSTRVDKGLPIIALTANAFVEDVQQCHSVGMDAHLAKPIDAGKMLNTVHCYMARPQ